MTRGDLLTCAAILLAGVLAFSVAVRRLNRQIEWRSAIMVAQAPQEATQ